MNVQRFYLCALPANYWTADYDYRRFAEDALSCERRIAKGVNLENEFVRYSSCCQRLEQEVFLSAPVRFITDLNQFTDVLNAGNIPATVLSLDYLYALYGAPVEGRIGASFFLPDQVQSHLQAFYRWVKESGHHTAQSIILRIAFMNRAMQAGCGIIEVQTSFHEPTDYERGMVVPPPSAEDDQVGYIDLPDPVHTPESIEAFETSHRKQKLAADLRQRILDALQVNEPITIGSEAQHDVITEVLNELVFMESPSQKPIMLRVMYVDGSEAAPFPLFCLRRNEMMLYGQPLRTALLSIRHPELDPDVDFCWFRNREVSRSRTLAETDAFCYNTTLTQIRDSLEHQQSLKLHLYHTGFEPAVIGFYRAVVETLHQRVPLEVIPQYYRGQAGYQSGRPWR